MQRLQDQELLYANQHEHDGNPSLRYPGTQGVFLNQARYDPVPRTEDARVGQFGREKKEDASMCRLVWPAFKGHGYIG